MIVVNLFNRLSKLILSYFSTGFHACAFILCLFVIHDTKGQNDTIHKKSVFEKLYGNYALYKNRFSNDTIEKNNNRYLVSNYSLRINIDAEKIFFDRKTQPYFGNYIVPSPGFYLYFKNFQYGFQLLNKSVKLRKILNADNQMVDIEKTIDINTIILKFGYEKELSHEFTFCTSIGLVLTNFYTEKKYLDFDKRGLKFELVFNKYIKLGEAKYLNFYLAGSTNLSRYNNLDMQLGDSYNTLKLGVGYKFAFTKKI